MRRSTALALATTCLVTLGPVPDAGAAPVASSSAPTASASEQLPVADRHTPDDVSAAVLDASAPRVAAPGAKDADAASGDRSTRSIVDALAAPRPAHALPSALDVRPRYNAQVSCDPVARAGTTALGQLLVTTYGQGTAGYARSCSGGGTSEHYDGRAVDWMVNVTNPAQKAAGDAATAWLTANDGANARRLGVQYIIWNRKTWRAYAPERGWTAYTGASPHTDHVHLSLTWDGALKRTSWWSGRAVTAQDLGPCPVYSGQFAPLYAGVRTGACPAPKPAPATTYRTWVLGQKNAQIATAQRLLGVTADGSFGSGTRTAVIAYQRRATVPVTGVLDAATWVALTSKPVTSPKPAAAAAKPNPAPRPVAVVTTPLTAHKNTPLRAGSTGAPVSALQRALGMRANGRFDAATTRAVIALQKRWGLPASGRVDLRTWNRAELTRYPWLPYVGQTLQQGSKGPAVSALQRAIGLKADGVFSAQTAASVRGVKKRLGLPATGIVDRATWAALTRL